MSQTGAYWFHTYFKEKSHWFHCSVVFQYKAKLTPVLLFSLGSSPNPTQPTGPQTPEVCDSKLTFDAITTIRGELMFFKDRYDATSWCSAFTTMCDKYAPCVIYFPFVYIYNDRQQLLAFVQCNIATLFSHVH